MEKNGARKGLLAHRQADSEILTKILEEKQGGKPPFKASEARKQKSRRLKAGKTLPLPSENNAFVEGKHTTCRGKTCILMWENRRFAPLKRTFSHQKRPPVPCFPLPLAQLEKRCCQPKAAFADILYIGKANQKHCVKNRFPPSSSPKPV